MGADIYHRPFEVDHFEKVYRTLRNMLLGHAKIVDVGEWHAMDVSGRKELVSRELQSIVFTTTVPDDVKGLQSEVRPNLPWAEAQFRERVSGEPLNPGETYKQWPWQSAMQEHMKEGEKFSHTYMERYWPKWAGEDGDPERPYIGICYRYGDLHDLLDLLARSPFTRQAYLPVWFPEDTGNVSGVRLPCSLGYLFLLRDGKLHCDYFIRSCDFVRHFRDDVYLTARLVQWVIQELQSRQGPSHPKWNEEYFDGDKWDDVIPGDLTMHIGSLHVMEGDMPKLKREEEQDRGRRSAAAE